MADKQYDVEILIKARNAVRSVIADAVSDFKELDKAAIKTGEDVDKSWKKQRISSKGMAGQLVQLKKDFNSLRKAANELNDPFTKLAISGTKAEKTLSSLTSTVNKYRNVMSSLPDSQEDWTNKLEQTSDAISNAEKTLEKFQSRNKRFLDSIARDQALAKQKKSFEDLASGADEYFNKIDEGQKRVQDDAQMKVWMAQARGFVEMDRKRNDILAKQKKNYDDLTKSADEYFKKIDEGQKRVRDDAQMKAWTQQAEGIGERFQREKESKRSMFSAFFSGSSDEKGGRGNQMFANLRGLQSELSGFGIAFAVKNIQALNSVVVGLAGSLLTLGGAAIGAGSGLAGGLGAGALQAIGPLTVLFSAIRRIVDVGKILNLKQQIAETSLHTKETGKLGTATDGLASAQENLSNSHRGVVRANENLKRSQEEVNKARVEARRKLQDLVLEEQGAGFNLEDARRKLLAAQISGTPIDVADSQLAFDTAKLKKGRASSDLSQARSGGVENSEIVKQAKDRLKLASEGVADAERQEAQAARSLASANQSLAAASDGATAAQDRLRFLMSQLTPNERSLVKALEKLKSTYKKNFRGISDIVIGELSNTVDSGTKLLGNKDILSGFEKNSTAMAKSIQKITTAFSGGERTGFLKFFLEKGASQISPITDSFLNLSLAILRIGKAASPIFDLIVRKVLSLSEGIEQATSNTEAMKNFFRDSKTDVEAFMNLLSSLWHLFTAIFDPARDQGRKTINSWADAIDNFANKLKENQDKVRRFFSDSAFVLDEVLKVLGAIAVEMHAAFNPGSVKAFSDLMTRILIPALGNAVIVMGAFARVVQTVLGLPVVSQLLQWVFGMVLLQRATLIMREAFVSSVVLLVKFGGLFTKISATTLPKFMGASVKAAAALTILKRSLGIFIVVGTALPVLNRTIGETKTAFVVLGVILVIMGAKFYMLVKAAGSAKAAIAGLTASMAKNPVGLLMVGLSAVAGFLVTKFMGAQKQAKLSTEELNRALDEQLESLRAVRDFTLDSKDASLRYQQSQIDVRKAVTERTRVEKELSGEGKTEKQIRATDEWKEANIRVKEAVIQRTRAERARGDIDENHITNLKNQKRLSEETIKPTAAALKIAQDEHKEAKDRLQVTRDRLKEAQKEHQGSRAIGYLQSSYNDALEKEQDKKKKLVKAEGDMRKAVKVTMEVFREMRGSIKGTGKKWVGFIDDFVDGINGVLGSMGVSPIDFNWKASGDQDIGGGLGAMATGGYVGSPNKKGRDNRIYALGDGEAVVNNKQQQFVNAGLNMLGINGLPELFQKTKGSLHYMASGGFAGLKPGIKSATSALLKRFPQLYVSSTTEGKHAKNSLHYQGMAADISGAGEVMNKASAWINNSGLFKSLAEGIHNPNLSVKSGKKVSSDFWGAKTWGAHANHIHLAVSGALGRFAKGLADRLSKVKWSGNGPIRKMLQGGSNKILDAANKFLEKQTGDSDESYNIQAGRYSKGQLVTLAKRAKLPNPRLMAAIAMAESGGDPNIVNSIGATGLWQIRPTPIHPWITESQAKDPMKNALAALRILRTEGLGAWEVFTNGAYTQFMADGGVVKGKTGKPVPIMAHADEWVLNPGQQSKIASMVGISKDKLKSALGFSGGPFSFKGGGVVESNNPLSSLTGVIEGSIKGLSNKNIKKALRALRDLTSDTIGFGAIGQVISDFSTKLSNQLKKLTFKIKRGKPIKALSNMEILNIEYGNLAETSDVISNQLKTAKKALRAAKRLQRRAKTKKQKAQASAGVRTAETTISELETSRADIAEQMLAKREEILQAQIDSVNSGAEFSLAGLGRRERMADVLGRGSVAASFGVPAVKNQILSEKNTVLSQQRSELQNILNSSSDLTDEKRKELINSVEDLGVEIAENNQAIKDNTTEIISLKFSFAQQANDTFQGLVGQAISITEGEGEASGSTDKGKIRGFLEQGKNALLSFGNSARDSFDTLLSSLGLKNTKGMSQGGLVQYILDLANPTKTNQSLWTPEQISLFQTLSQGILGNVLALQENSKALKDLNSSVTQTFSSTAWRMFRHAIFDGAGNLLPAYSQYVPASTPNVRAPSAISTGSSREIGIPSDPNNRFQPLKDESSVVINIDANVDDGTLDMRHLAETIAFQLKHSGVN